MPNATDNNGSSAIETGSPVDCLSTVSIPFSNAPPPVRTIPLSTISAANSGAVFSNAVFTASIIPPTGSDKLSATCLSVKILL